MKSIKLSIFLIIALIFHHFSKLLQYNKDTDKVMSHFQYSLTKYFIHFLNVQQYNHDQQLLKKYQKHLSLAISSLMY